MAKKKQKKRVRLSKEQRLSDILEVAKDVFTEVGYEDASMIEVAERLGIVEGTIYRYFATKRELLLTVIEAWLEESLSDYESHLKGINGLQNRLRYMIWHHLSIQHQSPQLCNLMVLHIRSSSDYETTRCYQLNQAYTVHTIDIIKEGIESGVFRDDIPLSVIRDLIYGWAEHHVWRYITGRSPNFDVEASADLIADLVYKSLALNRRANEKKNLMGRLENIVERMEKTTERT